MDIQPIKFRAADQEFAALVKSHTLTPEELCRTFGVPASLLWPPTETERAAKAMRELADSSRAEP